MPKRLPRQCRQQARAATPRMATPGIRPPANAAPAGGRTVPDFNPDPSFVPIDASVDEVIDNGDASPQNGQAPMATTPTATTTPHGPPPGAPPPRHQRPCGPVAETDVVHRRGPDGTPILSGQGHRAAEPRRLGVERPHHRGGHDRRRGGRDGRQARIQERPDTIDIAHTHADASFDSKLRQLDSHVEQRLQRYDGKYRRQQQQQHFPKQYRKMKTQLVESQPTAAELATAAAAELATAVAAAAPHMRAHVAKAGLSKLVHQTSPRATGRLCSIVAS